MELAVALIAAAAPFTVEMVFVLLELYGLEGPHSVGWFWAW